MCCSVVKFCCVFPFVQMITETTVVDDSMIGGNASAEGGTDDGAQDASFSGCNIVLANRLVQQSYDKNGFKDYIKVLYEYYWHDY